VRDLLKLLLSPYQNHFCGETLLNTHYIDCHDDYNSSETYAYILSWSLNVNVIWYAASNIVKLELLNRNSSVQNYIFYVPTQLQNSK